MAKKESNPLPLSYMIKPPPPPAPPKRGIGYHDIPTNKLKDSVSKEISVCDGKYTFIENDSGDELICKRYGEPWREFIGDKAVHALFDLCYEQLNKRRLEL